MSFKDLELRHQDSTNLLWVAEATELTSVLVQHQAQPNGKGSFAELQQWLSNAPAEFMEQMHKRLSLLRAG